VNMFLLRAMVRLTSVNRGQSNSEARAFAPEWLPSLCVVQQSDGALRRVVDGAADFLYSALVSFGALQEATACGRRRSESCVRHFNALLCRW
jgi:hypothetical protein